MWRAVLAVVIALPVAAQEPEAPRQIEPGTTVEREIASGDQPHRFRIVLEAGRLLRASVEQSDVDLGLRLLREGGESERRFDFRTPASRFTKPISVVPEADGDYVLEIGARFGAGRYTLTVEPLRDPSADDLARLAAESALSQGITALSDGTRAAAEAAFPHIEQAEQRFRALGDRYWLTLTLMSKADAQLGLDERAGARDAWLEAVQVSLDTGDRALEARARNGLGAGEFRLGQVPQAQASWERALELWQEIGDEQGQGSVLNNLGSLHWRQGENERALELYRERLGIAQRSGQKRSEAIAFNNMATVFADLGHLEEARDHYQSSLVLRRETEDRIGEARVLTNLGMLQQELGDLDGAQASLEAALELSREIEARRREANAVRALARLSHQKGDYAEALRRFQESLSLAVELGVKLDEAHTRDLMAITLFALDRREDALVEHRIAFAQFSAVEHIIGQTGAQAHIGRVLLELDRRSEARDALDEALQLSRRTGERRREADALYNLAMVERADGNLQTALERAQEAIAVVESIRGEMAQTTLRTLYQGTLLDYYALVIDLQMALAQQVDQARAGALRAQALEVAERARARSLLEQLRRGEIQLPLDREIGERLLQLRGRLHTRSKRIAQMWSAGVPREQIEREETLLQELVEEAERLDDRAAAASPGYRQLVEAPVLSAAEIQERVVGDGNSLLLYYFLGSERSWLWAVDGRGLSAYRLPGEEEINRLAGRAHELLMNGRDRRLRRVAEIATQELSDVILGPVRDRLKGDSESRLLIVADGGLHYIPFAALPSPSGGGLMAQRQLVYLPSATVLDFVRRRSPGTSRRESVAVVADPVYSRADPRVSFELARTAGKAGRSGASGSAGGTTSSTGAVADASIGVTDDVTRSATRLGISDLRRLPQSRREAEAIAGLVDAERQFIATDFDASKRTIADPSFGRHDVLHFATHGLLNPESPNLSGLVLSMVDRQGEAQDGFLRLHDVYGLQLDADMVVLSACRTALGRELPGDGVTGLARAFLFAGASTVVASLWDVGDAASAELMRRFYRGLLAEGKSPAAALQSAQESMAAEPRWRAPFYWAGFVLQGDWR